MGVSEGNPEWEPCEEYGHLYESCSDVGCENQNCKLRICRDCDDEYEED